jgi:two-component system chemotaxis response regulator CheY
MFEKKILIVDDSALMRKVLRDILEAEGYTNVSEAANGQEALDLCAKEKPELMFLDIIMPEVSGMDVLRELHGGVPTIVVSAVGQHAVIDEAKKLGALDFIVKPFDKDRVLDRARKLLK